jgi:hypothetical protein
MQRLEIRHPTTILLLIASLPGPLFLIWIASRYQLSLTSDSVSYISAADSLREGRGLISFNGLPYVYWPPMLPWVLAFLSFVGIPVIKAGAVINATSWFGAALISGVWLWELLGNRILACAIAFWISISAAILSVALYLWSEALFSFFLIYSLWGLHRYLSAYGRQSLLIAGLFCGFAALTRYVGAVLFGVEILVLSLFASTQRRFWFLIGFATIAAAPLSAWILRNLIVAGSATGIRVAGNQTLKTTFYATVGEVGSWFIAWPFADYNALAGIGILICLAAGVAISLRSILRKEHSPLHISTLLVGTFSIVYLGAIILAVVMSNSCCVSGRYEAPAFITVVLGVTFSVILLTEVATRLQSSGQLMLKTVAALLVVLGTSASLSKSISHARMFLYHGPDGYSQARFLEPDWIEYAKALSPDVVIFSNAPAAVYLALGLRTSFTPWRHAYASLVTFDELPAFARVVATTPRVFIVWFKEYMPDYLFDLKALQTVTSLKLVADFPHVSIYEVSTKPI